MSKAPATAAPRRISRSLKVLDRLAGIPLAIVLALTPKRPVVDGKRIRRIGLMKTAAIGDTLLLAGLLEDIRRAHPNASLVFIAGPDNIHAARLLTGRADEHVIVSPRAPLAAVGAIRRAKLDVIVDFGSWPRFDALLAALSGADFRVGFKTDGQFRHYGFDRAVEHSNSVHERENYRRLVGEIGVEASTEPRVAVPRALPPDRMPARPYIVFHPWSGGYLGTVKEWPGDRWVGLAQRLQARQWHIVVTGAAGDRQKSELLVDQLRSAGLAATNVAGVFSLAEVADVLTASEIVVSVNTGLMHLAALLGARTVSLEGPTPVRRWGPIGPRVRSVTTTFDRCGYLDLGFEYAGQRLDCMEGISVDAVVAAVDDLITATATTAPNAAPAITSKA